MSEPRKRAPGGGRKPKPKEKRVREFRQRTFRVAPDLDAAIEADPRTFQDLVDTLLREHYGLPPLE